MKKVEEVEKVEKVEARVLRRLNKIRLPSHRDGWDARRLEGWEARYAEVEKLSLSLFLASS